uniref:Morc6_S5 domain-containing protein n=1 Tax=Caenorhabditis tropicalis TaxID=1561998 RepID=A0A1I7V1G9_9PELO
MTWRRRLLHSNISTATGEILRGENRQRTSISSAIHSDPFSAIAEFVDNSYDAQARNLSIDYIERDGMHLLEFLDDGKGMTHTEALAVIAFGHSSKDQEHIGRYGNGLKSGGFHLGGELLLLTKRGGIRTAMLISHRFHEEKNLESSVFVPCPSIDQHGRPYGTEKELERFDMEMRIIHEYAPLGSLSLDELFNRITTPSGTYIIISRLRRTALGEFLINVTRDQHNILLDGDDLPLHKTSLREYLSIIYLYPRMKIYLRSQLVLPKKICENWMVKYLADIPTSKFKDAFSQNAKERQDTVENLKRKLNTINSDIGELNTRELSIAEQRQQRQKLTVKRDRISELLKTAEKECLDYKKNFKEEKISLNCGLEMQDRANHGLHFYINNRLIEWGYKKAFFKKNNKAIGVSAYVDLKSSIFRPTTNKQGFECAKTFNTLVKNCDEHLTEYFNYFQNCWLPTHMKNLGIEVFDVDSAMESFWNVYGYRIPFSVNCERGLINNEKALEFSQRGGTWFLCQRCRWWKLDMRPGRPPIVPGDVTCQSRNQGCIEQPGKTHREGFEKKENWKKVEYARKKNIPIVPSRPKELPLQLYSSPTVSSASSVIEVPSTSSTLTRRLYTMDQLEDGVMTESEWQEAMKDAVKTTGTRRATSPMLAPLEYEVDEVDEVDPEDVEEEPYYPQGSPVRKAEKTARQQARRPSVKVKRRLRDETDSDEFYDLSPERPKKKSKSSSSIRMKSVEPEPTFNREQYLEDKLNQFLELVGDKKLPKNGQRNFDPEALMKKYDEKQAFATNDRVFILAEYLKKLPNFPLKIPSNLDDGREILENLIVQIRQKKRN